MKNLDLNAYSVSEMSQDEMVNMDGGLIWAANVAKYVWKALIAIGAVAAAGNAIEDFKEGWDSVECGC